MGIFTSLAAVALSISLNAAHSDTPPQSEEVLIKNGFQVLLKRVPESHPEFKPSTKAGDFRRLRMERSGVVDFYYTSANGKFQGNIYCHLPQLIKYNEKISNASDVCFRLNVHEKDSTAVNGFGRQVGIY